MFRQELSETKSKILENLGASQSSESEQDDQNQVEEKARTERSLMSENFSKKKEVKLVYVSPDTSEEELTRKDDSMLLSSSSSKKPAPKSKSVSKQEPEKDK